MSSNEPRAMSHEASAADSQHKRRTERRADLLGCFNQSIFSERAADGAIENSIQWGSR